MLLGRFAIQEHSLEQPFGAFPAIKHLLLQYSLGFHKGYCCRWAA